MNELVFVVDNDSSMRNSVRALLESVGLQSKLFASSLEFLKYHRPDVPSCLVLEAWLPGMNGLEFQRKLAAMKVAIPIVFVTGHGDIPMAVQAMKAGAVDFLTKPFREQDLLDAVHLSLAQDRLRRQEVADLSILENRLDTLTRSERELFPVIVSGWSNKHVAAQIGKSEITVKVHRGNLMRKMHATSFADLLRMAVELGIDTKV